MAINPPRSSVGCNQFGTCGVHIDIRTLKQSLYDRDLTTLCIGKRIKIVTFDNCNVIDCASKEDEEILFRRSLEIGCDGRTVQRVAIVTKLCGINLESATGCNPKIEMDIIERKQYVEDSNGCIALLLYSITENAQ